MALPPGEVRDLAQGLKQLSDAYDRWGVALEAIGAMMRHTQQMIDVIRIVLEVEHGAPPEDPEPVASPRKPPPLYVVAPNPRD